MPTSAKVAFVSILYAAISVAKGSLTASKDREEKGASIPAGIPFSFCSIINVVSSIFLWGTINIQVYDGAPLKKQKFVRGPCEDQIVYSTHGFWNDSVAESSGSG